MASYHLHVKALSRTTGRSAVAAAAYRAGVKLTDERTGAVYDYSPRARAGSIVENYLLFPSAIDRDKCWAFDRSALWNRAEKEARRKDAKTAREIEMAIPAELNEAAASELSRAMGNFMSNRFGVAVDVARHAAPRDGDARNRHVHMLITAREITTDGFGARTKELDNCYSGAIREIRGQAATLMNDALERAGSSARVDHRSYADQGIDRLPGIHLGRAAIMEREDPGLRTRIGDRQREIERINAEMDAVTVARRELAEAGQAQRAATIDGMRNLLNLSGPAAPERSRWAAKRVREAAANTPEIGLAPVEARTLGCAPDMHRRDVSKRRKSRARVSEAVSPDARKDAEHRTSVPLSADPSATTIPSPTEQSFKAPQASAEVSSPPESAPSLDRSTAPRAAPALHGEPHLPSNVAALFREHPDAQSLAAEFLSARIAMNDARRRRAEKIAQGYLGNRLWTQIGAALEAWATGSFTGAAAMTAWAARIPNLSEARLKHFERLVKTSLNASKAWEPRQSRSNNRLKGREESGKERD